MPKKKQFLQTNTKQSAQGKRKQPELQTEDDFLEAADEFEKSGGKWRAGDAAKAARFFQRAVDAYSAGLQKYPRSFDLAYNKALLEYQITQDLRIAALFGHPIIDLLRQALASHEYALGLNDKNTDILFNTAQTLSDLADRITKAEAAQALQQAVNLMRRCLQHQVSDYEEMQAAFQAANSGNADAAPTSEAAASPPNASAGSSSEEYATIEEAVSERDILDAVFALTHMVADLLSLLPAEQVEAIQADVEFVVGMYTSGGLDSYLDKLDKTVPEAEKTPTISLTLSVSSTPPSSSAQPPQSPHALATAEAHLARAVLFTSIAEAQYRRGEISAGSYYRTLLSHFSSATLSPAPPPASASAPTSTTNLDVSCAAADALLALAAATAAPDSAREAGEAALAAAWQRDADTGAGVASAAAAPTADAVPAEAVQDDWPASAAHADALRRAHGLLAGALQVGGGAGRERRPQIWVSLGDAHWRLRNAWLVAPRQQGGQGQGPDAGAAKSEAQRAEACWASAERDARAVGVACAEEEGEARAKGVVARVVRGAGVGGGGGVVAEVERRNVLEVVGEMREEGLLNGVLAGRVVGVLGGA